MMKSVIDSSFLYELFDVEASRHERAVSVVRENKGTLMVPYVILTETAFLFRRDKGVLAVATFLRVIAKAVTASELELVETPPDDMRRAADIMTTYVQARLDFVDCCIMALMERMNVTRIYTFDRRDFTLVRPRHAPYLNVLP
jgi:predicted nucleic acid-binding protein